MGLFGRSGQKKKQMEKDREARQWEEINSSEVKAAVEQERAKTASLFDGARTLICGNSMFANMMVKDFTSGAETVEMLVPMEQEKLCAKCREFRPTILILTSETAELLEISKQVCQLCPDIAIVASSEHPEELPYTQSELRNANVYGVLKKPLVKEDFLAAIQEMKRGK